MQFLDLDKTDISALDDSALRELVARLCEAEIIQRDGAVSAVTWGGAQEAADGGLDVNVTDGPQDRRNFIPRPHTGFQVKKHGMGRAACTKEMQDEGVPKPVVANLAAKHGAYVIVSGKDDCSDKMLKERVAGMREAIAGLPNGGDLALDFYGRDRLAVWLRRHPGVALWARHRLGVWAADGFATQAMAFVARIRRLVDLTGGSRLRECFCMRRKVSRRGTSAHLRRLAVPQFVRIVAIRRRFNAMQTSFHSACALCSPRMLNWRNPRTLLIQPLGGSASHLRRR